jgi:hypothetical protein
MRTILASFMLLAVVSCGDDDGSEADQRGVGAQCNAEELCTEENQSCLTQFAGGYCGVLGCTADSECPEGSACIAHDDQMNYCFLICVEKVDCNINRDAENESNCSSSVVFVSGADGRKACVPPSSGT